MEIKLLIAAVLSRYQIVLDSEDSTQGKHTLVKPNIGIKIKNKLQKFDILLDYGHKGNL